jgi:magnesium chelatase family protein
MIARYQKRLSGPLIDRIDIHVEVPRVEYEKLSDKRLGETSAAIRGRVEAARKRQRERFKEVEGVSCNGEMRPAEIREFCELDAAGLAPPRKPTTPLTCRQTRLLYGEARRATVAGAPDRLLL